MSFDNQIFYNNIAVISNFPLTEGAKIKSFQNGTLARIDQNTVSTLSGWAFGTVLKDTVAIIDQTCQEAFQKLKESDTQKPAFLVHLQTCKKLCSGVSRIYEVYSKRYQGFAKEGVQELLDLKHSLNQQLNPFDRQGLLEEEKQENVPLQNPGWLTAGDGAGPNFLGNLYNGFHTGLLLFQDYVSPSSLTESELAIAPYHHAQITRLKRKGAMATDIIVCQFLQNLKEKSSFDFHEISDFYLRNTMDCNKITLENLCSTIAESLEEVTNKKPIVIPLALKAQEVFGLDHMVTIMIKDGCVEYFDPKGVVASHQKLCDGNTLRDFLETLNELYCEGKGRIFENKVIHQWDANNCGVFSCYFIRQKLQGEKMGIVPDQTISQETIADFRKTMIHICYQGEGHLQVPASAFTEIEEKNDEDDF